MNLGHLSIIDALKATPATEGGKRYVYVEASNESLDPQGDVVLAKALKESAAYYLKFGNLDLDHITQIGPVRGIANYARFEIGRPVQVEVSDKRTFVKGEIYSGEGPAAAMANDFWSSITDIAPPARWYPSIGGQVLKKSVEPDAARGKKTLIKAVRWTNVAFSKTPVNTNVGEVSTVPIGAFAKCWGVDGLDLEKALEAGYGTDSAALAGGAALRKQSLNGTPANYFDFRERISRDITARRVKSPGAASLTQWAMKRYALGADAASEWVSRFMSDLKRATQRSQS